MRDGEIVAVGDKTDVTTMIGPNTGVYDRKGLAVVPGLVDCHTHQIWAAELAAGLNLAKITSHADLLAALRQYCSSLAADAWVHAWNLTYDVFPGHAVDNAAIAEAVGGRPALLMFYDLHTAVATPRALALADLTVDMPFHDNSEVVSRDGVLTGELREPSAYKRVLAVADVHDKCQRAQRVVSTARRLAAYGLTGGHVMDGSPATYELLTYIESVGTLPQRLNVAAWVEPHITDEEVEFLVSLRHAAGRRWRSRVVKFFVDGVVETGTAWLHSPDSCGTGTAPFWHDLDRMRDVIGTFARHGFQCAAHVIGDRAVSEVLDIYESLDPTSTQAPHRLEHLELLRRQDIDRLASGGFVASLQPHYQEWAQIDDDLWNVRVGDRAGELGFRARDMARAGVLFALGSDWPVSEVDPRVGMAWARLGRAPKDFGGTSRFAHQTLTALQALEGYTANAATAAGNPRLGRIAPGYWADLSVFADDPVTVDADDLVDLPVELTIVDGELVYDRAAEAP